MGLTVAVVVLALIDRDSDLFQISLLFGVYSVTTMAMELLRFGGLTDTIGRKPVLPCRCARQYDLAGRLLFSRISMFLVSRSRLLVLGALCAPACWMCGLFKISRSWHQM